ncbi:hypothetical protein [Mycobacterium sp. CnD-18-1]|uniref:hypothetical protein n=1 Tax=Mycobacterium sp. CnD-18-1 TaxID=2917744 RepID=UPI001EF24743|nr:hypothetical protein [Mycobacterium sp. CnD-18-1]MCG7610342.1 hypothetical protein [Mycobacterium sp. CnD-18-1]
MSEEAFEIPRHEIEVECVEGGTRTLSFKSMTLLPGGILRKTRHDEQEQMWQAFEWAIDDPEDLAVLDLIPPHKLLDTLREMQKVSEVDLGKSGRPSTSSRSTRKRSRPTSSPSDSD